MSKETSTGTDVFVAVAGLTILGAGVFVARLGFDITTNTTLKWLRKVAKK